MTLLTSPTLQSLLDRLQARPLTERAAGDVRSCYISDLLSDVLAHAQPGVLWITIQSHRNVVSVASMKDIGAVLITSGRKPASEIIREAEAAGISLFCTPLTTDEAAGELWEAGLR